jgi:hypothetical protein
MEHRRDKSQISSFPEIELALVEKKAIYFSADATMSLEAPFFVGS